MTDDKLVEITEQNMDFFFWLGDDNELIPVRDSVEFAKKHEEVRKQREDFLNVRK